MVVTLVLVACGAPDPSGTKRDESQGSGEELTGRFLARYETGQTDETVAESEYLQRNRVLEDFVDTMNAFVRIPQDVDVVAEDCDEANAFYYADTHSITLCHELSSSERQSFADAGDSGQELEDEVYESVVSTLYHEAGHALIAELDLPATGREEDVADQMAAYILTSDDDFEEYLITTAASYYLSADRNGPPDDSAYADTHSLDAQRSVNFLCYAYGADPETFGYLVDDGTLDADRAEGCGEEFDQLVEAWNGLLEPYLR